MGTTSGGSRAQVSGWASFVAVYLLIVGGIHLIWGVAALANKDYFHEDGLLVSSLTLWAWVSIVVGVIEVWGGVAVLGRRPSGQIIALLVAILGTFTSVFTLGAYPVWSLIALGVDLLIIWAVTVHAEEFVD
jgi:ABC-type polysaccharide/polyol phosphate export permease